MSQLSVEAPVTTKIRLPTLLRSHAGGRSTVEVTGSTIGEVLTGLQQSYPSMQGQVLTSDGTLHRFVNVYVNDDDVRYLSATETPVTDADELSILPAVAGGALAVGTPDVP